MADQLLGMFEERPHLSPIPIVQGRGHGSFFVRHGVVFSTHGAYEWQKHHPQLREATLPDWIEFMTELDELIGYSQR